MTPYERSVLEREIGEKRASLEGAIIAGALGEWKQAVNNVKAKLDQVKAAKAKETARWDGTRLSSELQVYETLTRQQLNTATDTMSQREAVENLRALYDEAQKSGDIYKQRAAAEVIRGAIGNARGLDSDRRMEINRLAKQAERDLSTLRQSEELNQAHQAAAEAVEKLNQARNMLFDVDRGLGYTAPNGLPGNSQIIKALTQVQQDRAGNFVFEQTEQ